MRQYPEYKDTGIDWIDRVPLHWTECRIKTLITKEVNGVWGNEPVEDGTDLVCIRIVDYNMITLGVATENLTYRNIPVQQQNGRILYQNNLLIEKSGGGEKQPVGRVIRFNLNLRAVCSNFL